jgi:hypothetical protein
LKQKAISADKKDMAMRTHMFPLLLLGGLWIILPSCSTPSAHETGAAVTRENPTQVAALTNTAPANKVLRLTLKISDKGVETLSSVEADGALNRRDRFQQSSTFFRVVTKDNRVLFTRGFQMQNERRAEFADENGKLTRFQGPSEPSVISIVVPVLSGADKLQLLRHKEAAGEMGDAAVRNALDTDVELIGEVTL